ncbi:DNA glycosylase [Mycotypha africana]|uniref:DNA glycosylase n=1 Tax=Mycotypha africana TaxID=64632 RepID=UPI002301F63D|nr:DNA glycosylase [Mycotypha africana]KAI8975786.1 DNA glycosylase [Mycotypha africana]
MSGFRRSSRVVKQTKELKNNRAVSSIQKKRNKNSVAQTTKEIVEKIVKQDEEKNLQKTAITRQSMRKLDNRPSILYFMDKDAHLEKAIEHFKNQDPKLAAYLNDKLLLKYRSRLSRHSAGLVNAFRCLGTAIIYQQIHGKAAASIESRFIQLFTTLSNGFPTPEQVLEKSIEELRSAGLSARKAEYLRDLAAKFKDQTIQPEHFESMSYEEISKQLCSVKGIGQWTVDMFLMLDLHHSDILPVGDLGVRKGIIKHFGLTIPSNCSKSKVFPAPDQMIELTRCWRPYRTLGAWLMWQIQDIKVVGEDAHAEEIV